MATGIRAGANWRYDGGLYTIFEAQGAVSGDSWAVAVPWLGGVLASVTPEPISGDILKIIEDDIRTGNANRIAYIGVGGHQAVLLALEGVITVDQLVAAVETTDRIIMDIALAGSVYKLVVLREPSYTMATYDSNDEIV